MNQQSDKPTKLKRVSLYHATDRRYYHGTPCDDLGREIDSRKQAQEYLRSLGVHVTYFPNGAFYVGFDESSEIVTEDLPSFESCANACIEYVERKLFGEN